MNHPDAKTVQWAVYLGCNTPHRLAAEWGVTINKANSYLANARRSGLLIRIKTGVYDAINPLVIHE